VIAIRTSPRAIVRDPCVVVDSGARTKEKKPRPSARCCEV
jgi:hypothetical protein